MPPQRFSAMPQGFSFPQDVERRIFETAALRESEIIPVLLRVCHRVHAWMEPLLYRALKISYSEGISSSTLMAAIQSKSTRFVQTSVRTVWLYEDRVRPGECQWINDFLRRCSGIVNLTILGKFDLGILLCLNQLERLTLYASCAPSLCAGDHPLLSVTHLHLHQGEPRADDTWESKWSSRLACLPALTHLCLSDSGYLSRVIHPHIVDGLPGIRVIITVFSGMYALRRGVAFAEDIPAKDPRVVVIAQMGGVADWDSGTGVGAQGGDDFWDRSEKFVDQKRRGEIDETCYFLDMNRGPACCG
ncbi:hypothetical protein C8R44DRAFT_786042 [Mycena epipterygia]|nr:hypothetical protein C8R44DRAFT_786042 [Mycena epipterygia]